MWYIFPLISALSVTIWVLLQKWTLKKEHALQFNAALGFVIVPLSLVLIPFVNFHLSLKVFFLILTTSILFTLAALFHAKALRHYDVSIIAPFYNLGTAFLVLMALLFLGEHLKLIQISGISLLLVGAYVVDLKKDNLIHPIIDVIKSKYIHFVLLAVFLYSSAYLIDKIILGYTDFFTLFFFRNLLVSIFFLILIFTLYNGLGDLKIGLKMGGFILVIISILMILENLFLYKGMSIAPVSLVLPIYRLWTLFAVILGGEIFRERNLGFRILGSLIMILGAYLVII